MSYTENCTGTPTTDRESPYYGGSQLAAWMDEAFAQRFEPTSKCLDSIKLRIRRNVDYDIYVEIRRDSGGVPSGDIGSGYLGRYRIPYSSIPTSFTIINIPFKIVLPNLDPKWIVIYSSLYDPNYHDETNLFEITGDIIDDNIEYSAYKSGNNPWILAKNRKFYFITYKKTYSEPCVTPLCSFGLL